MVSPTPGTTDRIEARRRSITGRTSSGSDATYSSTELNPMAAFLPGADRLGQLHGHEAAADPAGPGAAVGQVTEDAESGEGEGAAQDREGRHESRAGDAA